MISLSDIFNFLVLLSKFSKIFKNFQNFQNSQVTGVISLSDILNFLVLRPGGDDPSQPGCTDMFSKVNILKFHLHCDADLEEMTLW